MDFIGALRTEDKLTENGMSTSSSSLDSCVDLFFKAGAMRGSKKDQIISLFSKAFNEDPKRAMKLLFWIRDVRGGAGERQIFKDILVYLAENHDLALKPNLHLIPEYGRWDDMLSLFGTYLENASMTKISSAIGSGDGLCAKWMPRKGVNAEKLRNFMQMSPKQYRKTLVNLTNVVETKMCSGEWDSIEFSKIPSVASSRYQKAFGKNSPENYTAYIQSLIKGETKINAGAVYPYDVTKSLIFGNSDVANEQWKALPNYMEGSEEMILPVVDTSGSMSASAGGSRNLTCMDVAISLGLYISERNEGPFKDSFITFSSDPEIQVVKGNLADRYLQMSRSDWGMNTNLEATFRLILDQAKKHNLTQDQMPNKILILSDMEFDAATRAGGWRKENPGWNPTAQQMIETMYKEGGYIMPQIVYWNIQSRNGGVPVSFDTKGTALVSGFSPSIMKSLLGGEIESPQQIMDKTIFSDRYAPIV